MAVAGGRVALDRRHHLPILLDIEYGVETAVAALAMVEHVGPLGSRCPEEPFRAIQFLRLTQRSRRVWEAKLVFERASLVEGDASPFPPPRDSVVVGRDGSGPARHAAAFENAHRFGRGELPNVNAVNAARSGQPAIWAQGRRKHGRAT